MRGKPFRRGRAWQRTRITPADAGKTLQDTQNPGEPEDHPRGCGENPYIVKNDRYLPGSPPRMRGKRLPPLVSIATGRITPADAGKTYVPAIGALPPRDHPRGCGENCVRQVPTRSCDGSPPRMRGKPISPLTQSSMSRITPADAGKTGAVKCLNIFAEDHPRGCGENNKQSFFAVVHIGSPPRMRGKLQAFTAKPKVAGITPADAGKTADNPSMPPIPEDHPRGCGENKKAPYDTFYL